MKNTKKGFIVPLLIAIIAVLAIVGGVYVYNQGKPTNTVSTAIGINVQPTLTAPAQNIAASTTRSRNVVTQTSTVQTTSSVQNCGESKSLLGKIPTDQDPNAHTYWENDAALVCIGKNILNNCKNSKAQIDTQFGSPYSLDIAKQGNNCEIKIQYPAQDALYPNKYIQCPISGLDKASVEDGSPSIDSTKYPGAYAGRNIVMMSFYAGYAVEDQTNTLVAGIVKKVKEQVGCTGTIFK